MKSFVVNRYGRLVFPFNFFPELDFSIFESLEQFAAVIRRDFDSGCNFAIQPAIGAHMMAAAASPLVTAGKSSSCFRYVCCACPCLKAKMAPRLPNSTATGVCPRSFSARMPEPAGSTST